MNLKRLRLATFVLFILWFITLLLSAIHNINTITETQHKLVIAHAKNAFTKDLMFRKWVAMHGGVYVFPTKKTPPNPYLAMIKDRDLLTTTGKKLTLMNPAYTLRELMDNFQGMYGETGHITSLKLLNPHNKPDNWEKKTLQKFEKKEFLEYSEFYNYKGSEQLRYMKALIIQQSCLKCHADQGYKVGDIRGGVSITIPMEKYNNDGKIEKQKMIYLHLLIFFIGLFIGYIIYKKIVSITMKEQVTEEKYHKEHDRIETILESNSNAIIAIDSTGTIVTYNHKAEELFGWKRDEMIDTQNLTSIIPSQCQEQHQKAVENFHKTKKLKGVFAHGYQTEAQNKNGEMIPIKISLALDKSSGLVIADIVDITLEKQQEKLLNQQAKLVSMGEMIGNIAHQWRQPLSVISTGATGMLMQKEYDVLKDEEFKKTCILINDNAQYLSKTIDDFRDFIKGERKYENFNLSNSIKSFLNLVEGAVKNNNIILVQDIQEGINIQGYPNELLQCLMNIFNNAKDVLKEIDDKRYIFITTKSEKDTIIITLKDNGGGIPENIIDRIFEPYFTTKHQSNGTGLGLNMTYKLITEGMKGNVEAYNAIYEHNGKKYLGAEFKVTLPLSHSI